MKIVDVNLVTWPNHRKRFEYFCETVKSLQKYLTASRHEIVFHCSSESQMDEKQPWFGRDLQVFCAKNSVALTWRHGPANLGANMNSSLILGHAETILLVQDDWELLGYLDLSPGIEFIERGGADLLRYSYPDIDEMRPTFVGNLDGWRRIDLHGNWPYGDDPHLRRRDFYKYWGKYLEGKGHGSASATLMQKLIRGGADIAAANRCFFKHFGDVTAVLDDTRNRRVTREDFC